MKFRKALTLPSETTFAIEMYVIAYYLPKQLYWIVYPSNGAAAAAIMVEEDKKKQ